MIERVATQRTAWLVALPVMLSLQSGAAHAQIIDLSGSPPDAAGSRHQPEYDPLGIRVGAATVYPSISLSTIYDTNVLASSTDPQSDFSWTLTPTIRAEVSNPNRTIAVNAYARIRRYAELERENDEQYHASALGRLNFGDTGNLQANASWSRLSPARGTYQNTLQQGDPLREDRLLGQIASDYRINRVRLRSQITGEKYDYDDVELDNGEILDQDYRDGTRLGTSLDAYYLMSSRFSLVVSGNVSKFDYQDSDPLRNRDALGTSFTAGGLYEITELLSFQLGIGYRKHNFDNPVLEDIDGFAFNGRVRWYPTPLVSVRLDLSQSTDTSTLNEVSAVTVSSAVLEADYELRRNNVLTGRLEYSNEYYGGLDANSDFMSASLRSNWKLNRWMRLTGSLAYERRTSAENLAIDEFDAFRGMLTVTLAR